MDTLLTLWLPIVVSAVLVFVASSLIWNVLGAHKWHIKGLPDEPAVREALSKQGVAAGMYSIPYCPDPAMMKDPAFKEKLEKGPVAVLVIRDLGEQSDARPPTPEPQGDIRRTATHDLARLCPRFDDVDQRLTDDEHVRVH